MTRGHRLLRLVQEYLSNIRRGLVEHTNRVAYGNERIVFARHGKCCAVLVSVVDAELLQRLEDESDVAAMRERLRDGDVSGYVPHDQVVADLSE